MNDPHHDEKTDEILGITRCARCGHRLEGEVECPFCSAMRGMDGPVASKASPVIPLWIYLTAILLTFPLSLPWLVTSRRLGRGLKAATFVIGLLWMTTVIWFL